MIARYTLAEMGSIWSEENKLQKWLDIEVAACEAWSSLGKISAEDLSTIKTKANFDIARVKEIENLVHHDVIAFLTNVGEYVGEPSKYIHLGMTSSDILDTGLALQMKQAAELLLKKMQELQAVLKEKALAYKDTLTIGRTHGIHGEVSSFGLKFLLYMSEMDRNIERMQAAKKNIAYGAISGAVGNFAHLDPRVEEYVCEQLGLEVCTVSTQIIQRDRHAQFITSLAIIASSLEKIATEIRNLQRTEILEVEEPFYQGQKGSSAMPHKKNPMISERVAGLARVLRGYALAAMENISLWHERDLTHSSVERIIIPDSCILLDYCLEKIKMVVAGLKVYEDNMLANINQTRGLVFSQQVMLALVEKGLLREEAYSLVQKNALKSWQEKLDFKELLNQDPEISSCLKEKDLDAIFDYAIYTKNVDYIYKRMGL